MAPEEKHPCHEDECVVDDANGNVFRGLVTSRGEGTASGFALVDTDTNGFGWPKGTLQYFENFKELGNGHFGAA